MDEGRPDPRHPPEPARPSRHGYLWALVVLVGAVGFVLAVWSVARDREIAAAEAEFEALTERATARVQQRMGEFELVARGGVSLFASVTRPTPGQWRDYASGLNLAERYPSLVGLGFAGYVRDARLPDLQREWREAGYGVLEVRPAGRRSEYGPILYLEPATVPNATAIGFDVLSERARRTAALAAMESGRPRLSGPVRLVQDSSDAPHTGMLLMQPVYAGSGEAGADTRRRSIRGWAYVALRSQPMFANLLGRAPSFAMHAADVTDGAAVEIGRVGARQPQPAFHVVREIDVYGRQWRLEFDSPPLEQAAPRLQGLQRMLELGLFSALLLSAIALTLAHTEARAQRIARRLTEDYRRSEQRFRAAMEYSAIGKALLDSAGRVVEVNPAFGGIVGRPPASLVGESFEALFEHDGDPRAAPFAYDGGVVRATRRLRREGGIARHAQLTYAPIAGKLGEDIVGLVQVEDVTERLLAEARIRALNRTLEARVEARTRELSQANQELEAFAYSVSHDLRAPLRAIEGFSRILVERYGDTLEESGQGYLQRVRRAASRMGELIDALLKMSRVSRSELRIEPVDLSRMAADIVEELKVSEPRRDIDVTIAPDMHVTGDAALLRNMLSNLLGNAWKFTRQREHARIEFHARTNRDGVVEYCISDNGAGFAPEYVDKLFRPFQRLHSAGEFAGHGIGLASVKRIVERHGGTVRAEGMVDAGARFFFTLPGVGEPPVGDTR